MKISFSTIACPDYSWVDIYSMAKDLGFDGIEIRGMGDDFAAYKAMPFTEANRPKTMAKLKALNIEIPCLSSGCCLKFKEKEAETIAELTEYCKLAQQINAPYIRVLADLEAAPNGEVDDSYVAEQLKKLAPIAAQYDVTLLVETNGVYSDTHRLRALLDSVNSHKIAALWDMHHPYRFAGESPEQTVANLGELIKYVHIKDSVMENGKVVYKMMGEGDLPIQKMIEALQSIQYTGYVSLEWVKLWMPNLLDAGVVFPQYAEFMRPFRRKHKHPLQDNSRKTGKYIWPKERLIDYTFPDVLDPRNAAFLNSGVVVTKFTGARGKSGTSDASAEFVATIRNLMDENQIIWQTGELGKVDMGGGGTVALYIANMDVDTIDVGVPVMSMHAPMEVVAKIDVYMAYKAFLAFISDKT